MEAETLRGRAWAEPEWTGHEGGKGGNLQDTGLYPGDQVTMGPP